MIFPKAYYLDTACSVNSGVTEKLTECSVDIFEMTFYELDTFLHFFIYFFFIWEFTSLNTVQAKSRRIIYVGCGTVHTFHQGSVL